MLLFRLSLTASLNSLEILNTGTSLGSTVTFSPDLGFRASRKFLCRILNDPNPLISMRLPVFRESMTLSKKASTTDSVSYFVRPVLWAIVLTRSAFVVVVVPMAVESFTVMNDSVKNTTSVPTTEELSLFMYHQRHTVLIYTSFL